MENSMDKLFTAPFRTPTEEQVTHELKILPKYYGQVLAGTKKWELRKNDRGFKEGDKVILKEWDDRDSTYTGRQYEATILYLLEGCPDYGLMEGFCIFSIS